MTPWSLSPTCPLCVACRLLAVTWKTPLCSSRLRLNLRDLYTVHLTVCLSGAVRRVMKHVVTAVLVVAAAWMDSCLICAWKEDFQAEGQRGGTKGERKGCKVRMFNHKQTQCDHFGNVRWFTHVSSCPKRSSWADRRMPWKFNESVVYCTFSSLKLLPCDTPSWLWHRNTSVSLPGCSLMMCDC